LNIKSNPLFYYNGELNNIIQLSEEESRHGALSLRLKEGETICITDGRGTFAEGICIKLNPKGIQVRIVQSETAMASKVYKRLCVAPPKTGERLDWMIEKAIEIGVNKIILLETQNSERNKINIDRLNKIAIATIKQSKQAYLPEISGIAKWKSFIEDDFKGSKFIAHVSDDIKIQSLKESIDSKELMLSVLIGPEGDFTREEVALAQNKGFKSVSLGDNVLRTETAAIYSLTIFNAFM